MTTNHLTFKRKDGVLGVGYLHDLATHKVYSVAWPDAEARKYLAEPGEMERMGVCVVTDEPEPVVSSEPTALEIAAQIQAMMLQEVWAENAVIVVDTISEGQPTVYSLTEAVVLASGDAGPFAVQTTDGVKHKCADLIAAANKDKFIELATVLGWVYVPSVGVNPAVVEVPAGADIEKGEPVVIADGVAVPLVPGAQIFDVSGGSGIVMPDVSNLEFAPGGVPCPDDSPTKEPAPNTFTEAQAIRDHLNQHGLDVSNKSVVEALKAKGVTIKSSQVTEAKELLRKELGS